MKIIAGLSFFMCALLVVAQPIPDIQIIPIASGFRAPTHLTSANDGSGRLFVVEQAGLVRVLDRSPAQQHRLFLSVKNRVNAGGEKGLLSIAFHPDFGTGNIWGLRYVNGQVTSQRLLLASKQAISSFGEDEAGEVYLTSFSGVVYQIQSL